MFENIKEVYFKIMSSYLPDYSKEYSIRELARKLNINYSNAFKRVKELVKKKILIERKVGKANTLSLNINRLEAINMLCFVELEKAKNMKNSAIFDIATEIISLDVFASIGLFGSRVSGKAGKKSDWDLFVITRKRREVEKIMTKFQYLQNIQLQVFSVDEFEESLLSSEETVIKHIVKNKQMIYNPYPFYNIIRKWEMIKYAPTE
jgi:predicted nucleotidyltransferase